MEENFDNSDEDIDISFEEENFEEVVDDYEQQVIEWEQRSKYNFYDTYDLTDYDELMIGFKTVERLSLLYIPTGDYFNVNDLDYEDGDEVFDETGFDESIYKDLALHYIGSTIIPFDEILRTNYFKVKDDLNVFRLWKSLFEAEIGTNGLALNSGLYMHGYSLLFKFDFCNRKFKLSLNANEKDIKIITADVTIGDFIKCKKLFNSVLNYGVRASDCILYLPVARIGILQLNGYVKIERKGKFYCCKFDDINENTQYFSSLKDKVCELSQVCIITFRHNIFEPKVIEISDAELFISDVAIALMEFGFEDFSLIVKYIDISKRVDNLKILQITLIVEVVEFKFNNNYYYKSNSILDEFSYSKYVEYVKLRKYSCSIIKRAVEKSFSEC